MSSGFIVLNIIRNLFLILISVFSLISVASANLSPEKNAYLNQTPLLDNFEISEKRDVVLQKISDPSLQGIFICKPLTYIGKMVYCVEIASGFSYYAFGNPTVWVDPTGHFVCGGLCLGGAIAAGASLVDYMFNKDDQREEAYNQFQPESALGKLGTEAYLFSQSAANVVTGGYYDSVKREGWSGYASNSREIVNSATGYTSFKNAANAKTFTDKALFTAQGVMEVGLSLASGPAYKQVSSLSRKVNDASNLRITKESSSSPGGNYNSAKSSETVGNLSNIQSKDNIVTGITNPLPENGIYSRVMPEKYAKAFEQGKGYIGGGEVWVTAADDLAGISTRTGIQKRLSLYNDFDATLPNTSGDVLVQFKLKNIHNNSLATPVEIGNASPFGPIQPRGYGFKQGGRTVGGAREWLIGNGTKDDIGALDIDLIYLGK